jgi:hypothetical protein
MVSTGLVTVDDYIQAGLTHSVHTSGRKSFRGCRRRWSWVFQDFWYPQITDKPLEFGVAYHKAMEIYYAPETWHMPREPIANRAIEVFKQIVRDQYDAYKKNFEVTQEVQDDYDERVELGIGMLKYHLYELAPKLDKNIKPYGVEIPFEVPITNPDNGDQLWCTCNVCWSRFLSKHEELRDTDDDIDYTFFEDKTFNVNGQGRLPWRGLPVTLGGRIDCLMEDTLGRYWVFDWKTAARISDSQAFLLAEDQITSYLWAMYVLGVDVAGFIYHEQKKAYPVEPEPNKVVRLGRRYSVSKAQDTTAELYRRTVAENDVTAYESGLYDEFIAYLEESEVDEGQMTRNNFFARFNVPRNREELENYGRYLYDEAADMTDPNLRIYPMAGRFSCQSCAFQTPCIGKNRGEDYEYTLATMFDKRKYHYWEAAESSTENEGRLVGA